MAIIMQCTIDVDFSAEFAIFFLVFFFLFAIKITPLKILTILIIPCCDF